MKPLAANLKHLYQRRMIWLMLPFLIVAFWVYVFLPLSAPARDGVFASYLLVSLLGGIITGSMQVDVVTKPFSFCLPGHRKIPGKFILILGTVFNIPGSLLFLKHTEISQTQVPVTILAAFCLGMALFSFSAYGTLNPSGKVLSAFWFAGFLYFSGVVGGTEFIETIILYFPFIPILLGVIAVILLLKLAGSDQTARRMCGKIVMVMFDLLNRSKQKKLYEEQIAENRKVREIESLTVSERFFHKRLSACPHVSTARYLWSMIYSGFSKIVDIKNHKTKNWPAVLLTFLLLCAFSGYSFLGLQYMVVIYSGISSFCYAEPVPPTMLLTLGRRARYFGNIFTMTVFTVCFTILISVVSAALMTLSKVMPEIVFKGRTLTFQSPDLSSMYLPLLVMPLGFALKTLFPKISVLGVPLLAGVWFSYSIVSRQRAQNPVQIISMVAVAWLVLILATRYRFMRSSYVGGVR